MLINKIIESIATPQIEYKISLTSILTSVNENIVTIQNVKKIINAITSIDVHLVKSIDTGSARIKRRRMTKAWEDRITIIIFMNSS